MARLGWACSISESIVVPDRGQPTTNTGRSLVTTQILLNRCGSGGYLVCRLPLPATASRAHHAGRPPRTVGRMSLSPSGPTTDGRPRSLADDLRAREDDALAALLRARPDLRTPVPADLAALAARATTRPSVQRALDHLDEFSLQVVDVLVALPDRATPD